MKPWHVFIGSILFVILMTLTGFIRIRLLPIFIVLIGMIYMMHTLEAYHRSKKPRFKDRLIPTRSNRVIRKHSASK